MTKKDGSKPLPAWAKALITLVAFSMIAGLAGVIGLTAALKHQYEMSQDPKAIAQLARRIIILPDPLPKGYAYVMGLDFLIGQVVSIDYESGKQRIVFISCPTDAANSQQLLGHAYERGMVAQVNFVDVLSEGGWFIHDTQIPYRVGRLEGEHAGTGLVACVVDQKQKRALLLYAIQAKGESFDMKACTELLQNAQPF